MGVFTLLFHGNGSSIVAWVFISAGTCLPPLSSNEIYRLSGVMSQYIIPPFCAIYSSYKELAHEIFTP
jgi:hypothetical protein